MATFRKPESQKLYDAYRFKLTDADPCALCEGKALQQFTYWKIMPNAFPYDRIADKHDMLVSLRHAAEAEITPEEWAEYHKLKRAVLNDEYDYLIEATHKAKSIPGHFHIHLLTAKD